jgi:hypothetical protein
LLPSKRRERLRRLVSQVVAVLDLPAEGEFRFVGKHLLLRDTSANIIVDYIRDVAP